MSNITTTTEATETVAEATTVQETAAAGAHEAKGGLEIQLSTIGFQALNFLLLVVVLKMILYKPLLKIMQEREKRIQDGIENADKADSMLKESNIIRQDMIKSAQIETQDILEKARKSGEEIRTGIVDEAHKEAGQIIQAGHSQVEMEKAKTVQEIKENAVNLIVAASEKVLRQKLDLNADAKLIEESLKSYSA